MRHGNGAFEWQQRSNTPEIEDPTQTQVLRKERTWTVRFTVDSLLRCALIQARSQKPARAYNACPFSLSLPIALPLFPLPIVLCLLVFLVFYFYIFVDNKYNQPFAFSLCLSLNTNRKRKRKRKRMHMAHANMPVPLLSSIFLFSPFPPFSFSLFSFLCWQLATWNLLRETRNEKRGTGDHPRDQPGK
jgi:hypothetical protein